MSHLRGSPHLQCLPWRKSASKKALKKAQKSYKDALVLGANKKHETPGPDHLDLIGRQQAVQILTHRASNGSQAEVTEPTQEDQQEQETEFMEVDPKNSELTRQREGEAPTRAQKKAK